MSRWKIGAGLAVFLAAACTQGKGSSPAKRAAPGSAAASTNSSSGKSGSSLRTYLAAARSVTPPPGLDKKAPATAVTDARVIKAMLDLLDLDQTVRGDRKPCPFQYQLVFKGAGGEGLGMIAVCAPAGGEAAARGTLMEPREGVEYQIAIPRARQLAALVKKKLPGAFSMGGAEAGWLRKHLEEDDPEAAR